MGCTLRYRGGGGTKRGGGWGSTAFLPPLPPRASPTQHFRFVVWDWRCGRPGLSPWMRCKRVLLFASTTGRSALPPLCIGSSLLSSSCTAFSPGRPWLFEHPRDQRQKGRLPLFLFWGLRASGCRHGHPSVLPQLGYDLELHCYNSQELLRNFSTLRATPSAICQPQPDDTNDNNQQQHPAFIHRNLATSPPSEFATLQGMRPRRYCTAFP